MRIDFRTILLCAVILVAAMGSCARADVWTCAEPAASTDPACASGGYWTSNPVAADLDPEMINSAYRAGFILMASGVLLAFPIRMIVKAVRDF